MINTAYQTSITTNNNYNVYEIWLNNIPVYVGLTRCPKSRLYYHIYGAMHNLSNNPNKDKYITKMMLRGFMPTMKIVYGGIQDKNTALELESNLIRQYNGSLLNMLKTKKD